METDEVAQGRPVKFCSFCKKEIERYSNYCNWNCIVEEAKANGGKIHCPNGLPIRSVDVNGNMWEHEHGDHPDYKFPVDVHYVGPIDDSDRELWTSFMGRAVTDEEILQMESETHALIYCDASIALTLYECCYAVFNLHTGMVNSGPMWLRKKQWCLAGHSIEEIKRRYNIM